MTLFEIGKRTQKRVRNGLIVAGVLTLAACAGMNEDEDSTVGSRLAQPPVGTPPQPATDAGDIAIVGQEVANSIMALPAIANASVPPLVQFMGVTSIVDQPIDTDPYTELLRDRLLLLTREKLRFVEHTLPPYEPGKKHRKSESQPIQNTESPDYQILAELRGHATSDFYRIQVEFVDTRSNEVLFNGLYRIRPEASEQPPSEPDNTSQAPPPPPDTAAPESTVPDMATPTTTSPSGNTAL
jgi:hypothetical protein